MAEPLQDNSGTSGPANTTGPVPSGNPPVAPGSSDFDTPDLDVIENRSLEDAPANPNLVIGSDAIDNPAPAPETIIDADQLHQRKLFGRIKLGGNFQLIKRNFDVYMIIFIVVILGAVSAVIYGVEKNKTPAPKNTNTNVPLSESALSEINNNDTQVGSNAQILTVQSAAVFNNSALFKGNLQVAGTVQIGGSLVLPGIIVTGETKLGNVSINNLAISGSEAVNGQVTIQQGMTVNGMTTFSSPISAPQLTVSTLQINGDIIISHHLVTIGSIPKDVPGPGIGTGGTTTVSGTDTAGQVTINTGYNATSGCLATINFITSYSRLPSVVISEAAINNNPPPVLSYYTERTTTGFSICSQDTPQASTFGFDYTVIE